MHPNSFIEPQPKGGAFWLWLMSNLVVCGLACVAVLAWNASVVRSVCGGLTNRPMRLFLVSP